MFRFIVGFFAVLTINASVLWAVEIPFNNEETIISGYNRVAGIALGDLDGNGTLDVTIAGNREGFVRHYSNDGNGSWTETIVASALYSPWSVAVGDIDGDGDGDILVGQPNNDSVNAEVIWYENPTNGINPRWVAHPVVNRANYRVRTVVLADMNRNGHLDVVCIGGNYSGDYWVEWVENDGTPSDDWGSTHSISTSTDEASSLAVADMDADGDLDVVVTDSGLDRVVWYANDVSGWNEHIIDAALDGARDVAVGDIDGNGTVDVIAAGEDGSEVSWYRHGSGGTWAKTTVTTSLVDAMAVAVVDMDMDGDSDILAAGWTSSVLSWYDNTSGDGSSWTPRTVDGSFYGAGGLEAGDVDGDGDPDVFASSYSGNTAAFWRNRTCHRSFEIGSRQDVWLSPVDDPRAVAVADLNGDGKQDVITGTWDGYEITAYLNDDAEAGVWVQNPVATGFELARDVAVADMDGDGDLDVLGAAVGGDAIRWWENLGPTTPILFDAHDIVTSYDGAHRVEAADFDRDGDMDVIVCAYDADDWGWVENVDGAGTSWTHRSAPSLNAAFDLAVGDLNFDGTLDVVVTAYLGDEIGVGLNHMPGPDPNWEAITVAYPADGPRGVDFGDFDGDGDLDIVAVLREANKILWFENDGTGEHWTQHAVGSGYFRNGVAVRTADLDGDGTMDVVATNQDERDVMAWLNEGDGTEWDSKTIEMMLDNTWDLDVADINNDGMMDVVVAAGDGADRLVWYANVGAQYSEYKSDVAPEAIIDGDTAPLLAVTLMHHGRTERDADLEPSVITVDFTDVGATPLASSQINALLERLELYVETNGTPEWQPTDNLVETLTNINLTAGTLTWTLTDGAVQLAVAPSAAGTFYIVATAQTGVLGQFEASIAAEGVEVEDADFDLPLVSEESYPVTTGIVTVGSPIFADTFESGDLSQWSSASFLERGGYSALTVVAGRSSVGSVRIHKRGVIGHEGSEELGGVMVGFFELPLGSGPPALLPRGCQGHGQADVGEGFE